MPKNVSSVSKAQDPLTDAGTEAQPGQWVLPDSWSRTEGAQHLWGSGASGPVVRLRWGEGDTHTVNGGFHPLLWSSVLTASWLAVGTL